MNETIDDLTIAFSEDGVLVTKELGKQVLTKGAWTTILYRYQDMDKATKTYSPVKYSIRRYQKRNNQYWQKSKFNISSDAQARLIINILTEWLEQAAT